MSTEAFAAGLSLVEDFFSMKNLDVWIKILEKDLYEQKKKVRNLPEEFNALRDEVDRVASYQTSALRDQAIKFLSKHELAQSENIDICCLFISVMTSTLTAVMFKGEKPLRVTGGMSTYRGFIAGTQSPEMIFSVLEKMSGMKSISGGRILTACVVSRKDMRAAAAGIASFFKIADILGLACCPISDKDSESKKMVIRFEGGFNLSEYSNIATCRTKRSAVIKSNRKNIYIMGPNGAGKSSWGNIISGQKVFEVGTSHYTTMIPQPCDVEAEYGFRIWDAPGLFDGSEHQELMEEYMNQVIDVNGYFSGVLFVFSGAVPANEITAKALDFAIETLGEKVFTSFFAIVNNFGGLGEGRFPTYVEMLYEKGFAVGEDNIKLLNAIEYDQTDVKHMQSQLCSHSERLVKRKMEVYDQFVGSHNDLRSAVAHLYEANIEELTSLLRRGKIEVIHFRPDGPSPTLSVPKDEIILRQHSKGYVWRKLKPSANKILEERTIKLVGTPEFMSLLRARLNQEYTLASARLFINGILGDLRSRICLVHTPHGLHDYELIDAKKLTNEELQQMILDRVLDEAS